MKYDLLIKNGYVVLPDGPKQVDIGIKGGEIHKIDKNIDDAVEVINATGKYVMPGMIDTHVHISEPGRTEWEGFITGSKALAAGGTTTYVEMPLNSLPATTNEDFLQLKIKAAQSKNFVDYGFYGGLVNNNLDDLQGLSDMGVLAFKCFLSSCGSEIPEDFEKIDDYSLYKGMEKIASLDGILCIHAENASITDRLAQEKQKEGKVTIMDYIESRPAIAEVEAVQRALLFAKKTNCKVHFVHISSQEAVKIILKARKEGVDVSLESCVHYFAINMEQFEEAGNLAKCQPPIRGGIEQEKLWEELHNGNIDWITSDHSPCVTSLKDGNIFEAWGGISGCQNSVDLMFDLAVNKRGMDIKQFVDLIATHPAKRFNILNKGEIAVSKDADIIILDPNKSYTLCKDDLYYKNKHSPYIGRTIDCRIEKTILRGHVVYDYNNGITASPTGQLIHKPKGG